MMFSSAAVTSSEHTNGLANDGHHRPRNGLDNKRRHTIPVNNLAKVKFEPNSYGNRMTNMTTAHNKHKVIKEIDLDEDEDLNVNSTIRDIIEEVGSHKVLPKTAAAGARRDSNVSHHSQQSQPNEHLESNRRQSMAGLNGAAVPLPGSIANGSVEANRRESAASPPTGGQGVSRVPQQGMTNRMTSHRPSLNIVIPEKRRISVVNNFVEQPAVPLANKPKEKKKSTIFVKFLGWCFEPKEEDESEDESEEEVIPKMISSRPSAKAKNEQNSKN